MAVSEEQKKKNRAFSVKFNKMEAKTRKTVSKGPARQLRSLLKIEGNQRTIIKAYIRGTLTKKEYVSKMIKAGAQPSNIKKGLPKFTKKREKHLSKK